ncbi:MAG: hypothetical protein HAW63_04540 [Bdellovibrionaceae bacterium]|nr:hypothetical protein [Pseudobdellovibrionaceae bacterium]
MFSALDWSLFFRSGLIFSTKPGYVVLSWGSVKESATPLKESHSWSFFYSDFYLKKTRYLQFENTIECSTKDLFVHLKTELQQKGSVGKREFSDLDFSFFEKQFITIQKAIEKKTITKAVPVIFQKSESVFSLSEKKYLLLSLLDPNNAAISKSLHIYGLFLNANGILGASPEILFSYTKKNTTLKSMALAGTGLSTDKPESLLHSAKDLKEHSIVSDYLNMIMCVLGDKATLVKSDTYEWDIKHLKHLRKDFQISAPQFCLKKTIKNLHPTPALGTSPQSQWNFLKTLEASMDRLSYGAPLVSISPEGNVKAVVAIRNIQWTQASLWLFVGCGIIAKSNLNKEFQELHNKIKSVKLLLGL